MQRIKTFLAVFALAFGLSLEANATISGHTTVVKIQGDGVSTVESAAFNTVTNDWVVCGGADYYQQVTGMTQSAGTGLGSWSEAGSMVDATNSRTRTFYAKANSGETGVKVRVNATANTYITYFCYIITGLDSSTPLDVTAGQTYSSSTTPSSGTTSTRSVPNQILLVFAGTNSAVNNTWTAGTGFTIPTNGTETSATHQLAATEYKVVSATGTDAGGFTLGTSANGGIKIVTFKDASQPAVGGRPPFNPMVFR